MPAHGPGERVLSKRSVKGRDVVGDDQQGFLWFKRSLIADRRSSQEANKGLVDALNEGCTQGLHGPAPGPVWVDVVAGPGGRRVVQARGGCGIEPQRVAQL